MMFNSDDIHVTRRLAEEGLLGVVKPKPKIKWRPFEEARKFVHSLGLKGSTEWREYSKSGKRPKDIPSNPHAVYREEWKGYGDWLDTGIIATRERVYRSFEEAREFVRSLGLRSQTEWSVYVRSNKFPSDIPSNVHAIYREEWISWGDWLGTGNTRFKEFFPFGESRRFVRSLGLKSLREWQEYAKSGRRPENIPSRPDQSYKEDWKGWGDWLGTGSISNRDLVYRPFEEARKFVRSLGLKKQTEWFAYAKTDKKPKDIPCVPCRTYKEEWESWGDWLGTQYFTFERARKFSRSLGIKNWKGWRTYAKSGKRPRNIPSQPWLTYKKDWKGMKDWLGKR